MSDQAADVVIIGGGAAGCAAAYYLASNGVKATVIEREGVASHASGYNAGGLNPLEGHGWPEPLQPMALQSFALHKELWSTLPAETGIDYNGRIMSILKVALDPEDLEDLRATLETFNSAPEPGFSAEWLEREDVLALEPRITPEVIAGIRAVGNGALDGLEFTQALAAGAEKTGRDHGRRQRGGIPAGQRQGGVGGDQRRRDRLRRGADRSRAVVPGRGAMAGHRHTGGSTEGADHPGSAGRPGLGL